MIRKRPERAACEERMFMKLRFFILDSAEE